MKTVRVLFLRATAADPWMNQLVSWLDPPFCHVELEFDMSQETATFAQLAAGMPSLSRPHTLASSVYAGESVFLRPRSFANPNYTVLTLNVTDRAFERMLAMASESAAAGVSFCGRSMYLSYFPFCCNTLPPGKTFCSAYVTQVLKTGGVPEAQSLRPERMRPSTLYRVLQSANQQCFSSVPYKINLISATPQLRM